MTQFSDLELNILQAKGLDDALIDRLRGIGIHGKGDFASVGDVHTLRQLLPEMTEDCAVEVMAWAVGAPAPRPPATPAAPVVVESADIVYCVHCKTKQPKDYNSGDLCVSCGKQAEPILNCYWCSSSGPGKFCRQCGAAFVPTAELDLAILLKREGVDKDAISARLLGMSAADKDVLWGRVRKSRG